MTKQNTLLTIKLPYGKVIHIFPKQAYKILDGLLVVALISTLLLALIK